MEKTNQKLTTRPPVVVVLGHVDSGKTSILDAIRKTNVAEKESGGITQHIGAYQIEKEGKKITFLDTPGHEAFSQMRSRGAKVADIAILVVDTCKGVEDQTKEAIYHIKKAEIPLIVALNKVDRPEASLEKTKGELAKEGILVESMGGKVPSVETSTRTGRGIDEILEMISLIAEMEELKVDISKPAEGVIVEAYLDSSKGPVATVILTEGILKPGDIIGTPSALGRIKSLENFQGKNVENSLPADPVVILGFENVPMVGENFKISPDTESAKSNIKILKKEEERNPEAKEGQKILNLILKTDVVGSTEAIEGILRELPQDKVILKIIKSEVGDINESDLKTARSSRSLVLGFRVKINPAIKDLVEREKVKILTFDIIYELVEGVRKFMERIMIPELIRTDFGKVKILTVFLNEKSRQIIGGRVVDGEIRKGAPVEVFRQEEIVGRGRIINLQRNKKDAEKAVRGEECGILYEGNVKAEEGDIVLAYQEETKRVEL